MCFENAGAICASVDCTREPLEQLAREVLAPPAEFKSFLPFTREVFTPISVEVPSERDKASLVQSSIADYNYHCLMPGGLQASFFD
jgi:hypothetical protein